MATKGKRKLVDVSTWDLRKYANLETFLERHSIPYTFQEIKKGERRRYLVDSKNLCAARSILLAIDKLSGVQL
jgi:hypothetical protein